MFYLLSKQLNERESKILSKQICQLKKFSFTQKILKPKIRLTQTSRAVEELAAVCRSRLSTFHRSPLGGRVWRRWSGPTSRSLTPGSTPALSPSSVDCEDRLKSIKTEKGWFWFVSEHSILMKLNFQFVLAIITFYENRLYGVSFEKTLF